MLNNTFKISHPAHKNMEIPSSIVYEVHDVLKIQELKQIMVEEK